MFNYDKFNVYITNLQAAKGRLESLKSIVDTHDIDLVMASETHLKKNDKFILDGFNSYTRNRKNAAMGGVATSVIDKYAYNTLKVCEGKLKSF